MAGLASCEMREEIRGDKNGDTDTGSLSLSVEAKSPKVTKAAVSTSDFKVSIQGVSEDVTDEVRDYDKVTDVPEEILLPVGTYNVISHTNATLEKRMDVPYYGGEETLEITTDVTTSANVVCKMQNSRIQLRYTTEFLAAFTSWTITLDDGSDTALSFTHNQSTGEQPDPIYWYFGENGAESVTLNISAKTVDGNTIFFSQTYQKKDAESGYEDSDNPNFSGGDALIIDLKPGKSDDPTSGTVTSIDVKVNILFSDKEEEVEIPVEDKEEEPSEPEVPVEPSGDPSLTCDAFATGVEYSIEGENWPTNTNVIISTPAGLKSLKATILGGNEGFTGVMDEMGFTKGRELVGDTEIPELLSNLGIVLPMPEADVTSYTFPIATFYPLMNIYGATVDVEEQDGYTPDGKDYHEFQITVEDNNGKTATAKLNVKIKK